MKQEQFWNVVGLVSAAFAIGFYWIIEFIFKWWFEIAILLLLFSMFMNIRNNPNTHIQFHFRIE